MTSGSRRHTEPLVATPVERPGDAFSSPYTISALLVKPPKIRPGVDPDRTLPVRLVQDAGATDRTEPEVTREEFPATAMLENTACWQLATAEQRQKLLALQAVGNGAAVKWLAAEQPGVLFDESEDGVTTLDSLHTLATRPLHPALARHGVRREALLHDLVMKLLAPLHRPQKANPGLATVVGRDLAAYRPGDYAFAVAGLAGDEGRSKLPGGYDLALEPDYFDLPMGAEADEAEGRGLASVILRSALAEGRRRASRLPRRPRR